jgi:hypothetical protein
VADGGFGGGGGAGAERVAECFEVVAHTGYPPNGSTNPNRPGVVQSLCVWLCLQSVGFAGKTFELCKLCKLCSASPLGQVLA